MKLELFYPITPIYVNQPFGTNGDYYKANGINILGHNGLDLKAYDGQPVYAAHDGVCFIEEDAKQGWGVVLITEDQRDYTSPNCPEGMAFFKTIYWHLLPTIPVKNGQHIKCGDLIGFADNTGLSTGDHLHFGLKPMREKTGSNTNFLDATDLSNWENIEQSNGYLGAIDPTPYFNGMSAKDFKDNMTWLQDKIDLVKGWLANIKAKVADSYKT